MHIPDNVKVIIIGAGSAGISALRAVQKHTDDYLIADQGPLGTKCARTGCMPSKALIEAANVFHRAHKFKDLAGAHADKFLPDIPAVLKYVRAMRDHFSKGMVETTKKLAGHRLITAKARIEAPDAVLLGDKLVKTGGIVIATGSSPAVPSQWQVPAEKLLNPESLFEQQDLPGKIAVIGLGPVGLELGLALSRLGIEVAGFEAGDWLAGLSDEKVNAAALEALGREFSIYLSQKPDITYADGSIVAQTSQTTFRADAVVSAVGFISNLQGLGLENVGIDPKDMPEHNPGVMQIADLPIYIAGDAAQCRPILHEALDEGFVAGSNAVSEQRQCFGRRTSLKIVFSDPEIAVVGKTCQQLQQDGVEYVVGQADFARQSRSVLARAGGGMLRLYAQARSGKLLGAQLATAGGEHLGHLLATAIGQEMSVFDMLETPYYHPTVEEGLRSALKDAASELSQAKRPELSLCESSAEPPLC